MSDNLRRYRAIRNVLMQAYPTQAHRQPRPPPPHPGGAHQWHRGQQEHAVTPHRRESTHLSLSRFLSGMMGLRHHETVTGGMTVVGHCRYATAIHGQPYPSNPP